MQQRKLIKLGNSSFAIALPKTWINKSGLKKGDDIFLEENSNGEIRVMPSPIDKTNDKRAVINIENKTPEAIQKEIRAAYIRGYSSFQIDGIKTKQDKDNIKKILSEFLSFELIESGDNKMIAKDFFSLENASLSNFIRRMDNNIREIFDIVKEEINKEKISPQKVSEIEEIDKDVNKFYFLLI